MLGDAALLGLNGGDKMPSKSGEGEELTSIKVHLHSFISHPVVEVNGTCVLFVFGAFCERFDGEKKRTGSICAFNKTPYSGGR